MLFSFARAYFMVDMEVPAAYVQFLRSLMPQQAALRALHRARPAEAGQEPLLPRLPAPPAPLDRPFLIAPGIKGMVMMVFTCRRSRTSSRSSGTSSRRRRTPRASRSRRKYLLVKQHDRVGRMADTLEYSNVGLPARPLRPELIDELHAVLRQPARGRRRRAGDPPRLHRAADDPAQHLPARGDAGADRACGGRVRQRDQGHGRRQHLPRRHAVEELRRHAPRQGGVLRLRRDLLPHRLQLPPRAGAAQRGRRDVAARPGTRSARRTCSPRRSRPSCSATRRCARSS